MNILGIQSSTPNTWSRVGMALNPMKRPVALVMPFLKIHPATMVASTVAAKLHGCVVTSIDIRKLWLGGKYKAMSYPLLKSVVSISAIGALVFNHPIPRTISAVGGVGGNLHELATALQTHRFTAAGKATWDLLGTALAIATVLHGVPQAVLIYVLYIVLTEMAKCLNEYKEGRAPEALARLIIAYIFTMQLRVPFDEMCRKAKENRMDSSQ